MKTIQTIREIADAYDAFFIDLWGVMHDGTRLYAGAKDAIAYLHAQGKQVVFLSNAPRRTEKPLEKLLELGIAREQFLDLVTSGQVAYEMLKTAPLLTSPRKQGEEKTSSPVREGEPQWGQNYYYLGPSKDEDILDGLAGYTQVNVPEQADFVLNTGFEYDYQPEAEIEPLLKALRAENLPFLCVNPDLEVITPRGQLLCAGWAARRYEELGGEAHYIGKPHASVYEACFTLLGDIPRERVLGIGDNFLTDIRGANAAGIDSLLITGGILRAENGAHPDSTALEALCQQTAARPTYVAELLTC